MADGLLNVIENYETAIEKTNKMRNEIIKNFSFEKMAKKYMEEMSLEIKNKIISTQIY